MLLLQINRRILRLQDEREKASKTAPPPTDETRSADEAPETGATAAVEAVGDAAETPSQEQGGPAAAQAPVAAKGRKLPDLELLQSELDRLCAERQQLAQQLQMEEERRGLVTAWTGETLRLIAPQTEADLAASVAGAQPLHPLNPTWRSSSLAAPEEPAPRSHAEAMRVLREQLAVMLPPAAVQLQQKAQEAGILAVEDVLIVLDAFRWMSWCHLGLFLLRFPPPTTLLRRFVTSRPAKLCDDKILRHLQGVLAKASLWKGKARKTSASTRKVDDAKLRAMVLEANNLPFSSRLKTHYQEALWRFDNKQPVPGGGTGPAALLCDHIRQIDRAACDSSDDDVDTDDAVARIEKRPAYVLPYPDDADSKLAAQPKVAWPIFGPHGSSAQTSSSSNAAATHFLQQQSQPAAGAPTAQA